MRSVEEQQVDEPSETPPLALRVLGGGEPSAEQLAAIVVALTPAGGDDGDGRSRAGGWARAAMIEGVGGRPPTSPADLDASAPWG